MVEIEIANLSQAEWTGLVAGFSPPGLLQSWEYGEAKAKTSPWKVERGLLREGGEIVGAFQALVRPLPAGLPGGLVWINRGPLAAPAAPQGGAGLGQLLAAIRRLYVDGRGRYLRIALPVLEAEWSERDTRSAGFAWAGSPGWASAVLDLGQSLDALRANLRANWRSHLGQAERAGIDIRSGTDEASFQALLDRHRRMIDEKAIATSVTPELLAALQALLPPERKMRAFLAHDGEPIAWALIFRDGDVAEYLAGGTATDGRKRSAGQLLLWRAIAEMKEAGVRYFDMGGMDARATPSGVYLFKSGIGGQPYRLAPEIEAVGGVFGRFVRWRVRRAREGA